MNALQLISSLYLSQTFIPKITDHFNPNFLVQLQSWGNFFIYASYNWTLFYSKTDLDNNMEMSK